MNGWGVLGIICGLIAIATLVGMEYFPRSRYQDYGKHTFATTALAAIILLVFGCSTGTFWVAFGTFLGVGVLLYFVLLQRKPTHDHWRDNHPNS